MKKGNLISIGKLIKLSGHTGELIISGESIPQKIKTFVDPVFIELENVQVPFYIRQLNQIGKDKYVVSFDYVSTEKKASALLFKDVFILTNEKQPAKKELTVIGYKVHDLQLGYIGDLKWIDDTSKNPLMIIDHQKSEILIPFQEEFIEGIDHKNKILSVKCPEGLLDLYLSNDEEE